MRGLETDTEKGEGWKCGGMCLKSRKGVVLNLEFGLESGNYKGSGLKSGEGVVWNLEFGLESGIWKGSGRKRCSRKGEVDRE